jgi:hypothetical protein
MLKQNREKFWVKKKRPGGGPQRERCCAALPCAHSQKSVPKYIYCPSTLKVRYPSTFTALVLCFARILKRQYPGTFTALAHLLNKITTKKTFQNSMPCVQVGGGTQGTLRRTRQAPSYILHIQKVFFLLFRIPCLAYNF